MRDPNRSVLSPSFKLAFFFRFSTQTHSDFNVMSFKEESVNHLEESVTQIHTTSVYCES